MLLRTGAELPWMVSVLNEVAVATAARERAATLRIVMIMNVVIKGDWNQPVLPEAQFKC
jgi:hypothetical protein